MCKYRVHLIEELVYFFFFNDTATTEIYPLSLHDALPICALGRRRVGRLSGWSGRGGGSPAGRVLRLRLPRGGAGTRRRVVKSGEHTAELQSPPNLVCRLFV